MHKHGVSVKYNSMTRQGNPKTYQQEYKYVMQQEQRANKYKLIIDMKQEQCNKNKKKAKWAS